MMANVGGSVGWEESWENKSDIRVTSREYTDGQGNNIIYYCCRTTYFDESQMTGAKNQLGVDQETLKMVIDLEQVSDYRQCKVGEWPAVLCEKDGYTYLCWTISSEYSCVIKYDAAVVTEQEIWRMAESVAKQ